VGKKRSGLGELELEVLKVIWRHQPCAVQEVADLFHRRRGYARTTVLTVMQRLHKKGFLKRRKVEGVYRYKCTEQRGKVVSRLIEQFVDKVLDGSAAPFVTYLTEAEDLTEKQAAVLQSIAEELESKDKEK
jgi:predicted transcriptional regulator